MDPCRNAKGCDDALRENLCEVVLAGFVFILFSLSGFVKKFLLSLALVLVLCCFQECRRCKKICRGRRHASTAYFDFVLNV